MERFKNVSEDDCKLRLKSNEKALEPIFFQLEKLAGGAQSQTMGLFWLEHVDLRYFMTENLQQRLFAIGEFGWWAEKRAHATKTRNRFMTDEMFIQFVREHKVFERLFDKNAIHREVLSKAGKLITYLGRRCCE